MSIKETAAGVNAAAVSATTASKKEGGLRLAAGFERKLAFGLSGAPLPLVSVITIVYNGAEHIERTIESVLSQKYKNIEYIIVDGGSTDATPDIIKKYEDRLDYWISEKDRGISDAMNKGIALASGEITGMIHSGDWYEAGAIGAVVAAFLKYSPGGICGALRLWNGDKPYYRGESDIGGMYYGMSMWHPTVFIKTALYRSEGVFDLKYKSAMDYDLLTRFIYKGHKFLNMRGFLIANMSRGGTSESNRTAGLREEYDIRVKNGVSRAAAALECLRKYFICCGLQFIKKIMVRSRLGFVVDYLRKIRNAGDGGFIQ